MIKRLFWNILLLIAFSFSIVNAFVIQTNETDHCSVQEYAQEFSQSNDCGDLCDVRHMFYISFILPESIPLLKIALSDIPVPNEPSVHVNGYISSTFRPPIAV